jgi:hypothetical protein
MALMMHSLEGAAASNVKELADMYLQGELPPQVHVISRARRLEDSVLHNDAFTVSISISSLSSDRRLYSSCNWMLKTSSS